MSLNGQVLADVCEFIVDCEHKTAMIQASGYPSIRTPNIGRGRLILEGVNRVSEETYRAWTRRAVPVEGDLILAREAPVGNVAIVPKSPKVCLGQRTVLIRPDKGKVCPSYLLYLLLGDEIQGLIHGYSGGATVSHLNMSDIRGLKLPVLPDRKTQQDIGCILSAYDDLIENNTQRIRILEEMAQAIYREWFVNFRFPGHQKVRMVDSPMGKIPQGWETTTLGDSCHLVMGQSPKSEFYNETGEGLPFHQGVTDFGDRFPTDRIYCTVTERIAEEGDILFSVRAPVGRINVAVHRLVIGRGVAAIRSKDGHQFFLLHQIKEKFQEEDSMGNGAIFKAVTKTDMTGIKILRPDAKLLDWFDEIARKIGSQIKVLTFKNNNLRKTRDLLLPKLISGEVDVSDLAIQISDACGEPVA